MTCLSTRAALFGALCLPLAEAVAQRPLTPAPASDTRPSIPLDKQTLSAGGPVDTAALSALRWRELGPFRGGRSVAVAGSTARPNEYYMGTTGGGVFKTLDGGQSWAPITDKYFGGTIGAVAVSASAPDVVYAGGGEYALRGNVSHGEGVWKSTDAGKTWTSLGLKLTRQISRVVIHPTNPDIVFVAAQGNVWAPTPDRGVAFLAITSNGPTSQMNRAPFQELYKHNQADFSSVLRPVVKRSFQPTRVDMLPLAMRQAFDTMVTGRPGPVNVDIPYNVYQEEADVAVPAGFKEGR